MAEETSDSSTEAPKGIIKTVLATGIGGFAIILTLLFAISDPETIGDGPVGVVVADIFMAAGGPKWGPALIWIVFINYFFAGLSSVAVSARITYALARDDGFPMSSVIKKIHPTLKAPINSLIFVFLFDGCLLLILLGSTVAYVSIVGLSSIGYQVCWVRVKVRVRGLDMRCIG